MMDQELKNTFTRISLGGLWGSKESMSGTGSELGATETLRKELPEMLKKFNIKSILDIPCGDFHWMKEIDFNALGVEYRGADIVSELITRNKILYPDINFEVLDITQNKLPKVDLIFVRDCLGHLSDDNIFKALGNIRDSGSTYLAATSFTKWNKNPDIPNGSWKCINLMIHPYLLKPIYLINENCKEGYPHYNDKCILLFKIEDLNSR